MTRLAHMLLLVVLTASLVGLPAYCAKLASEHEQEFASANQTALELYREKEYAGAERLLKDAIEKAHELDSAEWLGTLMSNLSAVYSAQSKDNESKLLAIEADAVKHPHESRPTPVKEPEALQGYLEQRFNMPPQITPPASSGKPQLRALKPLVDDRFAPRTPAPTKGSRSRHSAGLSESPPRGPLFLPFPSASSYGSPTGSSDDPCNCAMIRLTYYHLMLMDSPGGMQSSGFSFQQVTKLLGF